jgi:hypothetical protein
MPILDQRTDTGMHMTTPHKDIVIWATILLAAAAAALFIDQDASVNSRVPVLIAIAIVGRLAIRITGLDRTPAATRRSHSAGLIALAVLVAVSIPILITAL